MTDKSSVVFPGYEWEKAAPESQGVETRYLKEALDYLSSFSNEDGIKSTFFVRNGRCIWEGEESTRKHDIFSCTKSITSTVFGLMVDDGLCSLETYASDYSEELKKDYAKVQLKQFATMTSGYNAVGGEYGKPGEYADGSKTAWIPREPIFTPPGSQFHYHDDAMREFGYTLQKIAQRPLEDIFRERIADPIGMTDWRWPEYIRNGHGNDPASSFQVSAREFARLGLLILNEGCWDGKQLISKEWVQQATETHTRGIPAYRGPFYRGIAGANCYGYNWWVNVEDGVDQVLPELPYGSFWASGYNHNKMWIIPEWNMIITRLGSDGSPEKIAEKWNVFFRILKQGLYM